MKFWSILYSAAILLCFVVVTVVELTLSQVYRFEVPAGFVMCHDIHHFYYFPYR